MSFRSLLFVPGSRPDRFAKAVAAGADAVCIDLEDAVPPHQKAEARAAVMAYLAEPHGGRPAIGLRMNALASAEGVRDVAALLDVAATPAFLMVPKARSAAELEVLADALAERCPPLWPVIESATGLKAASEIAAFATEAGGVLFGGADFSADVGCAMTWEALLFARSSLAAACAASGAPLLDVPYLDVADVDGLRETTARAKALGFSGRACIHPDQVAAVNAVFTPDDATVARALRVIEAFEAADGGAALLDGKLVELPLIRAARRVLAAAGR